MADQSQDPPPPVPIQELSHRSQWASFAMRKEVWDFQRNVSILPDPKKGELLPASDTRHPENPESSLGQKLRVGIIGAGVSGLFTALTFDYLKEHYDLDVEYEILEANGDERLGGRLYTYYFKDKKDEMGKNIPPGVPDVGPHDYYDVGAMRFPDIEIMARTFALFKELDMQFNDQDIEENRKKNPPKKGQLVPYHLNGKNQPMLYNSVQIVTDGKKAPTAADFEITGLPIEITQSNPSELFDSQISYYTYLYKTAGPRMFWNSLTKTADHYSVRQYLTQIASYDYNTIEFLETMNFGNRWYDQAFSEAVLEALDFDPKARWWCVEGGSQQIAHRMSDRLQQKRAIEYKKRVLGMSYVDKACQQIDVNVRGEDKPRRFDAVFNSVPLGAMQQMSLEGLKLNWGTKQAIRSLGYGASCKIGVRFKSLWWIDKLGIEDGGQGKTDLPIRCCVYPSYNMHDPVDKPGVLLVSYTWSQEAERIGALISRESPANEDELKLVVLHDLARLHSSTDAAFEDLKRILTAEYLDHYAYNWYADPTSVGAFAFFGPGQFQNMYPSIVQSHGKHIIIGEAASSHHAWVVGALESAVRGVYQFLWQHASVSEAARRAAEDYAADKVPMPFGPVPAEYDRTQDIRVPSAVKDAAVPSPKGELVRQQAMIEEIRLKQGGDVVDTSKVIKEDVAPILTVVNA